MRAGETPVAEPGTGGAEGIYGDDAAAAVDGGRYGDERNSPRATNNDRFSNSSSIKDEQDEHKYKRGMYTRETHSMIIVITEPMMTMTMMVR